MSKKSSESNKSATIAAAAAAATTSTAGPTISTNGYAGEPQKSDNKTTGKTRLSGSDSEEDLPLVHVKQQKVCKTIYFISSLSLSHCFCCHCFYQV